MELRKYVGHKPLLSIGATIIVTNNHGQILLNLRSDTKTWGIPGGAMELGETIEETAKRELLEETGLILEEFDFLTVLSGKDLYFKYPNGDEVYSVIVLFKAKKVSGELNINDGESTELKYFNFDALPRLESRAQKVIDYYLENGQHCMDKEV